MKNIVSILSVIAGVAVIAAVYCYTHMCPTPSPNITGLFEGEAKLSLVSTTNKNYLDNNERGSLGKAAIRIDWDEVFRYYIDLQNDAWKPSYDKKENTVTLKLPKIEGFKPTILSHTIKVTVDPAVWTKEWKVLADLITEVGTVSQQALDETLNPENPVLSNIQQKVKSSLEKIILKHFALLKIPEPTINVVFFEGS